MKAYSQDLRDRVLRSLQRGDRPVDIARRFEVSREWVYDIKIRFKKEGINRSFQIGGSRVSCIAVIKKDICEWISQKPDLTLEEICALIAQKGLKIKASGLWHQLNKWNLTLKKNSTRQRARKA